MSALSVPKPVSVLVIDNYDSFTYNLVQYLGEFGASQQVVRNDAASADELVASKPDCVVVSPGPGTPGDAGVSVEAIARFARNETPVLGVCLGHQALAVAFGGRVVRGSPVHGKYASVTHDGEALFEGIPTPFQVGRYHSLVVEPSLPEPLICTAVCAGTVMAIRHGYLPAQGVQFHPESILTLDGKRLLFNFVTQALAYREAGPCPIRS
jgi:anthranilate synthase/aminodeoxychorismate synthase-like glutamine amidotransferase